ncbi:hypothetical protein ACYJ1Y_00555 [Natrialbaceae archaeon A-gly3]
MRTPKTAKTTTNSGFRLEDLETGLAASLSLMMGGFGLFICWAGIRLA